MTKAPGAGEQGPVHRPDKTAGRQERPAPSISPQPMPRSPSAGMQQREVSPKPEAESPAAAAAQLSPAQLSKKERNNWILACAILSAITLGGAALIFCTSRGVTPKAKEWQHLLPYFRIATGVVGAGAAATAIGASWTTYRTHKLSKKELELARHDATWEGIVRPIEEEQHDLDSVLQSVGAAAPGQSLADASRSGELPSQLHQAVSDLAKGVQAQVTDLREVARSQDASEKERQTAAGLADVLEQTVAHTPALEVARNLPTGDAFRQQFGGAAMEL